MSNGPLFKDLLVLMQTHNVETVTLRHTGDGNFTLVADGGKLLESRLFNMAAEVQSLDPFGFLPYLMKRVGRPDIGDKIMTLVNKFYVDSPWRENPNLLILGPEEHAELMAYIVRIQGVYLVSDPTNQHSFFNGMKIVRSKDPGISVARE